jgi:hypothetical protein
MKRRNLTCLQKLTTSLKHLSSILAQKSWFWQFVKLI